MPTGVKPPPPPFADCPQTVGDYYSVPDAGCAGEVWTARADHQGAAGAAEGAAAKDTGAAGAAAAVEGAGEGAEQGGEQEGECRVSRLQPSQGYNGSPFSPCPHFLNVFLPFSTDFSFF